MYSCDDNDIIESVARDSSTNQVNQMDVNGSMESMKNDESSQDFSDSKDVVSCIGDSLAQTDADDNFGTSPPAKRVREIDDKESMDHHSSTKKKLVTVKIEKP